MRSFSSLFRCGEQLLLSLAEKQPLVLLIEDLHWADEFITYWLTFCPC